MNRKFLIGAFIIIMIAPFSYTGLLAQVERSKLNYFEFDSPHLYNSQKLADSVPSPIADSIWKEGMEKMTKTESLPNALKKRNKNEIALIDSLPRINTKFKMKKSPLIAVLLSAVVPGAGQFYNQSYWKIPIIGGLVGYFGYEYIRNNKKFIDYRDQYNATITPENEFGDQNLKTLREFYRNQRNDFVWYFMIVYVVNLVDAYVDAHLFDFDIKDNNYTSFGNTDRTYRLKMNIRF